MMCKPCMHEAAWDRDIFTIPAFSRNPSTPCEVGCFYRRYPVCSTHSLAKSLPE